MGLKEGVFKGGLALLVAIISESMFNCSGMMISAVVLTSS